MTLCIERIDHIVMTVNDIEQTIWFYCDVLGMEEIEFGDNKKALGLGNQKINLHEKTRDLSPVAANPVPGSLDICLISSSPLDEISAILEKHGIEIEEGPVLRQGAQGEITSVYCRDPDGNLIEIANTGNHL
jgi:catechol 2,3-dioxygenase-like lactoylglutathione lyase family enzyme